MQLLFQLNETTLSTDAFEKQVVKQLMAEPTLIEQQKYLAARYLSYYLDKQRLKSSRKLTKT